MTSTKADQASDRAGFTELVFSDFLRQRSGKASWPRVLALCATNPGMVASLIVRAQQCLGRSGHPRAALLMRSIGSALVGADFNPGMTIGKGLWLAHPQGVTIGFDLTIGDNVTFAGGVTAAARHQDARGQRYATICDGAVIGAHAVLIGEVRIGRDAMVGANSVVTKDVPDNAVVMGNPARQIGTREASPDLVGSRDD